MPTAPTEGREELPGFRFHPSPDRGTFDEARLFSVRIRHRLRAAAGLGLTLELDWTTGPEGGVVLRARGTGGTRWVASGLSSIYRFDQWRPVDAGPPPGTVRAYAASARGSESPFASGTDLVPWCETVLEALTTLPAGLGLRWSCVPDPALPGPAVVPRMSEPSPPSEPRWIRWQSGPERSATDAVDAKRFGPHWTVRGELWEADPGDAAPPGDRLMRLVSAASREDGGNAVRFVARHAVFRRHAPPIVLSEAELAGLLPSPWCTVGDGYPRPEGTDRSVWVGRTSRGEPVGLPVPELEGRHLVLVGETGMGKSSLLVRLGWQALRWGSVVLLDPMGETARQFLAGLPPAAAGRTLWVSPASCPLGLNALDPEDLRRGRSGPAAERLVNDLVTALRRIRAERYADSGYWGPRLEEMASLALSASIAWPGGTLELAERLLSPDRFPTQALPELAAGPVRELRRRLEARPDDGEGARRLVSEVVRNPTLRTMLCAPAPAWRLSDAVGPGRVLVFSGDAPRVGEQASRYLLAVDLALLWAEVLRRPRPTKTFLLLDEVQWYGHDSLGEMLRFGRRFNLHVWCGTQALGSLPEHLREALLTNAADLVVFRGSPIEAREFGRWIPELGTDRLLRLPRGWAAALIGKGSAVRWVQTRPLPPLDGDPEATFARPPAADPAAGPGEASRGTDEPVPTGPVGVDARRGFERALLESPEGPELPVHLADLRAPAGDRSPDEVRELGRTLSRNRILLRRAEDARGAYWVLDRGRLREWVRDPASGEGAREPDRPRPTDPGELPPPAGSEAHPAGVRPTRASALGND